jgi:hypothetical protein
MNKLLFVVFVFVPFISFAEEPPMSNWSFNDYFVTLNGKAFLKWEYSKSWREQDGYAIVSGRRLHYWLYDSYTYRNGDTTELYRAVATWVEGMGYVIDFDNIRKVNPNPDLASSVKALMTQRGCDVSVALVTDNPNYDYVVINEYSKSKGIYWTTIYYLYY